MAKTYEKNVGPTGGHLVARRFKDTFREEWFDPDYWGEQAEPVSKGGRGSAWFLAPETCEPLVLRHFARGGLPGRFIKRDYLFLGVDRVRSLAEFRLLDQLYQQGLPVPEPVAAGFIRRGLFYRAQILITCIPDARPLADFTSESHASIWWDAGVCVRQFHNAGVYHADLNCMNILVADRIYLIDFDRGQRMNNSDGDWRAANLRRLERSVAKFFDESEREIQGRLWRSFLAGYEASPADLTQ